MRSDEYPQLDINVPLDIELQPQISLFYRVLIADLPSPLKFEIKYHGLDCRLSGLEVFLSTTNKNPDPEHYEAKFYQKEVYFLQAAKIGVTSIANQLLEAEKAAKTKNAIALPTKPDVNVKKFDDRYIYVCLNSYSGCSITMAVKTIASRQDANKLALERYRQARKQFSEEAAGLLMKDSDPYVQAMKIEDEQLAERLLRFREMTKSIGFENLYYPNKERDL